MDTPEKKTRKYHTPLEKCPSGIAGLDIVTSGGLPRGRSTLVAGGPGCGKTVLSMQFLLSGAVQQREPGVMITFKESPEELAVNFASFGYALEELLQERQLFIDHIEIEAGELQASGSYDLSGLFIRIESAIEAVDAKQIVLDSIDTLFAGIPDRSTLRMELHRLFRWLKEKGLTAIVTAEQGENSLTHSDLEAYVSDCVIALDRSHENQISTRKLRIVKYRGSDHCTNVYPFLIEADGIHLFPVTTVRLNYEVSTERVPMGISDLDKMLNGGIYRGSTTLVSGMTGTGKSSIAARFAEAACQRGERCLYFAFEESPDQVVRNMRSIGIDLAPPVDEERLKFRAIRPTYYGLEAHLVAMHKAIQAFDPHIVVLDPVSSMTAIGSFSQVAFTLMRLIDMIKSEGRTALLSSLIHGGSDLQQSEVEISSLIDTWLLLRNVESSGEYNRVLHLIKSRGMAHSNQVREFILSDEGIELVEVYLGPGGVLTGAARAAQEAKERQEQRQRESEIALNKRNIERKRAVIKAQIEALKADLEAEGENLRMLLEEENARETEQVEDRQEMARIRGSGDQKP